MYPERLHPGPLPESLATRLRSLVTSSSEERITVEAPFTGSDIGWVPSGTAQDVAAAFAAARLAQREWDEVPFEERRAIAHRFHDLILDHRELLMDVVQLETGKDRSSAFDEVMDIASTTRYYANTVEKLMAPSRRTGIVPGLSRTQEHRFPIGVVGQISPWNYPLTLAVSDAVPALLAGNAVVAKPDSATPFTALLAVSLLIDAGLPPHLFRTVTGPGSVVGQAIAEQCDYLMFTGSTATGRLLGEAAGRRLIGFSAELGGKNPMIVSRDADLEAAVDGAVHGCLSNSGQLCVSIERIYVDGIIYGEFLERFVAAVESVPMGAGFDWDIRMGSLASAKQLDTVSEFVDDARDAGATIRTGGHARPDLGPYFYEPTILTDVPETARLNREEVFGPVVTVQPVSDLAEAIVYANDSDYGLNASIFAAPKTAWAAAPLIRAGGVNINDGYLSTWANVDTPLGGLKDSGLSARHGEEGLRKYTETRNISEQRGVPLRMPQLSRKHYADLMSKALKLGRRSRLMK